MPHLILEYSANLTTKPSVELLAQLHDLLPRIGPFDLYSIKSRIVEHSLFYVADGQPDAAFVHLQISILSGRDIETKRKVSRLVLEFLQAHFCDSLETQPISLTVEVRELEAESYSKLSTIAVRK